MHFKWVDTCKISCEIVQNWGFSHRCCSLLLVIKTNTERFLRPRSCNQALTGVSKWNWSKVNGLSTETRFGVSNKKLNQSTSEINSHLDLDFDNFELQHPVFTNVRLIVSWISCYCCRQRKQSRSWSFVNLHIGWINNGPYHLLFYLLELEVVNFCRSL